MTRRLPSDARKVLERETGAGFLLTRHNVQLADALRESSPRLEWTVLTKQDVRGWGALRMTRALRRKNWRVLIIEDESPEVERRWDLYRSLLVLGRGRHRWVMASRDGSVVLHPVRRSKDLLSVLGATVGEVAATVRGLFSAWSLNRSMAATTVPPPCKRGGNRVAMLRTSFWFGVSAGGSVSHALGVIDGMQDLGMDLHVWTAAPLPTGVPQTVVEPPRRPSAVEEAAVAAYNRIFLERIEAEVRRYRPSLVYHRHDAFSLAGLALARRLGVPLVLEVNASEVWARRAWSRLRFARLARAMERTAFEKADRLVLISEELVPIVRGLGGTDDRIVVSPNGVDVTRFGRGLDGGPVRDRLGIPGDSVVCGFLGTFTRWHGVLFLADQVPLLLEGDPGLHFLFLGDGDLRPEVERRIGKVGASERATFTGLLSPDRVPELLAACDILLSPHLPFEDGSVFFGSPTKLFEYMAAGKPTVASRLGQIARVIEDGETGILCPPGDGDAFRKAVLGLANDPGRRARLGSRAREVVESRYTWKANVERALSGILTPPTTGHHGGTRSEV